MSIKGILFDKDGTIVDFKATFEPATLRVLNELCGVHQTLLEACARVLQFDLEKQIISESSVIVAGSSLDIASELGAVIGRSDLDVFAVEIDQRFGRACAETVRELPRASASLSQLHSSGYVLGIATNDAAENAQTQMENLGIEPLFSQILGADSGYGAKPDGGMISAFMDFSKLRPEEVMMVGDSTHDLQAGRAAGVVTCAVETGPASRRVLEPYADYVLASIGQISHLLKTLNQS